MTDTLDGWRWAMQMAREGDPRYLFERLFGPGVYMPLPDDAELRRAIVELLMAKPWARRGRQRALHPVEAGLARHVYRLHRVDGESDADARAHVKRVFGIRSDGALDDLLRQRKTYAKDHKPPKEAVRLARKKPQ